MSFDLSGKVIAVLGATGAQGGSVVQYLLKDGKVKVRAITRNADSASAKALKESGAEVVVANIDDQASLEKAFEGAYGVYGVTNFWEHYWGQFAALEEVKKGEECFKAEVEQGKKVVNAVKKAGVKHFLWSSIPHIEEKEDQVPHFESKYEVEEYARKEGVPSTFLITSFYYENFITFHMLGKNDDGTLALNLPAPPGCYFPSYSVGETGGWVLPIFANPEKWIGKYAYAKGGDYTPPEFAAAIEKASGKKVTTLPIDDAAFLDVNGVRKQAGLEMWLNFKAFFDHPPGPKSFYPKGASEAIYPEASDFATFAAKDPALKAFYGS